jgi:hypothetical protein
MKDILLVIITGLLTLGGSFLGPFFQNRQLRFNANLGILRDRAQDIFDEIDVVVRKSQLASVLAMQNFAGTQGDQPNKLESVADLGRIRGLVATYYPTALPILAKFEFESDSLIQEIQTQLKLSVKDGVPDNKLLKALPAMMATSHQKIVSSLASELRNHITEKVAEYAPKLLQ